MQGEKDSGVKIEGSDESVGCISYPITTREPTNQQTQSRSSISNLLFKLGKLKVTVPSPPWLRGVANEGRAGGEGGAL